MLGFLLVPFIFLNAAGHGRNMSKTNGDGNAARNRLLAALPRKELNRILPDTETVLLSLAEVLYETNQAIRHVYFPLDCVVSLLSSETNRSTLEVGVVGNEGMAGLGAFLGIKTSRYRAIVQGEGTALRMEATALRRHAAENPSLQVLLKLYTHALLVHISLTTVCNQFHPTEARLARWLLAMRDRLGKNEFQMTQEFLSNMLGIRREMVNKAATALAKRGLIAYLRGVLTILDGAELEAVSCECYEEMKAELDNFLGKNAAI